MPGFGFSGSQHLRPPKRHARQHGAKGQAPERNGGARQDADVTPSRETRDLGACWQGRDRGQRGIEIAVTLQLKELWAHSAERRRPAFPPRRADVSVGALAGLAGCSVQPPARFDRGKTVLRRFNGRSVRPVWVFGNDDRAIPRCSCLGRVGRIFNNRGESGTGALVGDRIVITAGHLVPWGDSPWWMRSSPHITMAPRCTARDRIIGLTPAATTRAAMWPDTTGRAALVRTPGPVARIFRIQWL